MTHLGEFLKFRAHHVDNGIVRAAIAPDIGGRVLQFWLDDHPYLFVNQHLAGRLFTPEENWGDGTISSWKNYGGNKTWPAPQGWDGPDQWAGPPDPVLDSGRFDVLDVQPSRVMVQSPPDPRSGLQITRELTLEAGAARAVLRRTMRNVSDRQVRWSLWDVTQMDCATAEGGVRSGCWMTVPFNPVSAFSGGYEVLYGPPDNQQWDSELGDVFGISYRGELGKVGLDSQAGWVAFSDPDSWVLVHQFELTQGATYPDNGATVEVWTHGPGIAAGVDFGQEQLHGRFMEMEILGPLVDLEPGQSSSADIVWGACRCRGPIVAVGPAGCTGQQLELRRDGGEWRVKGTFGVFAPCRLQLRLPGTSQVLLERSATPLEPVLLDDEVTLPSGAGAVELVAVTGSGQCVVLART